MNGKENIINKILADADNKCNEIIADAQRQAQDIADAAQEFDSQEKAALQKRLGVLAEQHSHNNMVSAQMEASKYKLLQKQGLIAQCYQKAAEQIKALPAAKREDFLAKLINLYAENGETVFACKADKDIVTQKFLDGFGKKLVLGKTFIDADGGLILEGVGYDKDLTLQKIVAYAREQTESKVAAALFGE